MPYADADNEPHVPVECDIRPRRVGDGRDRRRQVGSVTVEAVGVPAGAVAASLSRRQPVHTQSADQQGRDEEGSGAACQGVGGECQLRH